MCRSDGGRVKGTVRLLVGVGWGVRRAPFQIVCNGQSSGGKGGEGERAGHPAREALLVTADGHDGRRRDGPVGQCALWLWGPHRWVSACWTVWSEIGSAHVVRAAARRPPMAGAVRPLLQKIVTAAWTVQQRGRVSWVPCQVLSLL